MGVKLAGNLIGLMLMTRDFVPLFAWSAGWLVPILKPTQSLTLTIYLSVYQQFGLPIINQSIHQSTVPLTFPS